MRTCSTALPAPELGLEGQGKPEDDLGSGMTTVFSSSTLVFPFVLMLSLSLVVCLAGSINANLFLKGQLWWSG